PGAHGIENGRAIYPLVDVDTATCYDGSVQTVFPRHRAHAGAL
ncbi:MAG: hypothetical protein ACI9W2_002184, partial [Gammaproteobacteria bacterium]